MRTNQTCITQARDFVAETHNLKLCEKIWQMSSIKERKEELMEKLKSWLECALEQEGDHQVRLLRNNDCNVVVVIF